MSFPITRKRALEIDLVSPQNAKNYIDLLPLEILVQITFFSTLDQAVKMAGVCRLWRSTTPLFIERRIADTSSISYGELEAFRRACTDGYLKHRPQIRNLLQRFTSLKTFILGDAKATIPQLSATGKALCDVKVIDASGQKNLTEERLQALLSNCCDLEVLSLANSKGVTSALIEWIILKCPSIKELNLSGTAITDYALGVLAVDCSLLQCVHITACKHVTHIGVSHLKGKDIEIIRD